MPRKTDTVTIDNPFLDKRVKLLPCHKQMIKFWNDRGLSQRKIAKMFNVSRRLIQFELDPVQHIQNLERRAERGGTKQYYDKVKHRDATRAHREHKKQLFNHLNHNNNEKDNQ